MKGIHPVTIPKWGIEMQEGTVTEWRLGEGDAVSKGDELIDIESEKIVNTMEAPADGVLRRVLAEVGSTLKVGQLLGVIAPVEMSDAAIDAFVEGFVPADAGFGIDDDEGKPAAAHGAPPAQDTAPESPPAATGEGRASPVARRLAEKLGVDLSTVTGTGRNGRISTSDVEAAAANQAAEGDARREGQAVPLSSRELAAARRLVASKQEIPHFYLQRDLDLRGAMAAKAREGVPFTALLLKALAAALLERPRLNAHLQGESLLPRQAVAVNVAVDTPEGLVAPRLDAIDTTDIAALSGRLKELAEKARGKQLSADDLAPGGMTLSNLGMFGVTAFTAIINPPQVAILAIGRLRPLELEEGQGAVPAMTATLSCDHRAIDGAEGARFLQALQEALDNL